MGRYIKKIGVCKLGEAEKKAENYKMQKIEGASIYISKDGVVMAEVPIPWFEYCLGYIDAMPVAAISPTLEDEDNKSPTEVEFREILFRLSCHCS